MHIVKTLKSNSEIRICFLLNCLHFSVSTQNSPEFMLCFCCIALREPVFMRCESESLCAVGSIQLYFSAATEISFK